MERPLKVLVSKIRAHGTLSDSLKFLIPVPTAALIFFILLSISMASVIASHSISNAKLARHHNGHSRRTARAGVMLHRRSRPWWDPPALVLSCGPSPLAARATGDDGDGGGGRSGAEAGTKPVSSPTPTTCLFYFCCWNYPLYCYIMFGGGGAHV